MREQNFGENEDGSLPFSRDELEFFLDKADLQIWFLTDDSTYFWANRAHADFLGKSKEEVKGLSLEEIFPVREEAVDFVEQNRRLIREKSELETKKWLTNSEGQERYLAITRIPYFDSEEEIKYIVCNARDITARKKTEKELKNKKNAVEKLHHFALKLKNKERVDAVCELAVETAETLLDFSRCNIALIDEGILEPIASSSQVDESDEKAMEVNEGLAGLVFREQQSRLSADLESEPEARPVSGSFKSGLTVPIDGQGVFQAVATEKEAFDRQDLDLAELLMAHTTSALDRIKSRQKIRYKTFHDELTGLYNRAFLEQEAERLNTSRQLPLSLIMVDINGLKLVNDSFGHKTGDELLKRTGQLLKNNLRQEDILGRWAGDEFVILLPRTGRKEAEKIISRIEEECRNTEGEQIPISLSIGLAVKTNADTDFYDVLNKADKQMYDNKLCQSQIAKNDMIKNLLKSLRSHPPESEEHSRGMIELARDFGEWLGLESAQMNRLKKLAAVHDIGKVTISEDILTKADDLNEEEWKKMRRHSEKGYRILLSSDEFMPVAEEVLSHHEHWDGGGYPRGLEGENIPLLARMLLIIDAYNIMTGDQPYQETLSPEEALAEIERCAGSQFDPRLAEEFIAMMEASEKYLTSRRN